MAGTARARVTTAVRPMSLLSADSLFAGACTAVFLTMAAAVAAALSTYFG